MKAYIGIDLGGSNIKAGTVNEDGNIINKINALTKPSRGYEKIIMEINDIVNQLIKDTYQYRIQHIGIGLPGYIDEKKEKVIIAPNLNWKNVLLKNDLEKISNYNVIIDNDANCAALGEALFGIGVGFNNLICITIGTGIGAGIILNKRLYRGSFGNAGEIGHMPINENGPFCNCGGIGCLESLAAAPAIMRKGKKAFHFDKAKILRNICNNDISNVTTKRIFEAAKAGDEVSLDIVKETAKIIGIGVSSLIRFFDPELIVIGGGVSAAGKTLIDPLINNVNSRHFGDVKKMASIKVCKLKNDAGIIGASMLNYG